MATTNRPTAKSSQNGTTRTYSIQLSPNMQTLDDFWDVLVEGTTDEITHALSLEESPKSAEFIRQIKEDKGKLDMLCEEMLGNTVGIDVEQEDTDVEQEDTDKKETEKERDLLKLFVSTFDVNVTADLTTSPMCDLVYDKETRTLPNKREDLDYILAHFNELTDRDELGYPQSKKLWFTHDERVDHIAGICEEFMGGGRRLTDEERARVKAFIEKQLRRQKRMIKEMGKMRPLEWKAWYDYLTAGNWHSYDSYPLNERLEVWEEFVKHDLEWEEWEQQQQKQRRHGAGGSFGIIPTGDTGRASG
ncbi:hypothetical protein HK104_005243 [Borealophlyctis nickersoniae]|nr:hypothetical protein HK104_005243 [Borealophlyctis nickersoniae]